MAHTLNLTKLEEGEAHATFHYFMKSDGASGELSAQTLVDPTTDFSPVLTAGQRMIVKHIWYEVYGFNLTFLFGSSGTNWPFWVLTPGVNSEHDWRYFGGIKDTAPATPNGKLLITTAGFATATSLGSFVIRVEKRP